MAKRHLRFFGNHPRQTPSIGQFFVWLVTTFFTVTAAVEVTRNFFYDGGISRRGYTLIVIAVVAFGLVYFERRFGQVPTYSDSADGPLTRPVPEVPMGRIGIRARGGAVTGGKVAISNQDIGIDEEESIVDIDDLRIT